MRLRSLPLVLRLFKCKKMERVVKVVTISFSFNDLHKKMEHVRVINALLEYLGKYLTIRRSIFFSDDPIIVRIRIYKNFLNYLRRRTKNIV